ncbi:acetyl-CoA carboxylase biotin carboxyl carrier protein subunit [Ascidiimonas sp. W6]|uniref:acetyl-CoA carboxylase biotin carboxyl carrier protein subunit n=1 Tax=Ascidiimonas meishanensis TaxID=3128903 RepID=UPI0030EB45E6
MAKNTQFQIKVNQTFSFSLQDQDTIKMDIIKTPDDQLHLIENRASLMIEILNRDFETRNYTLKINGNEYQIKIETELDILIDKLGLTKGLQKKVDNLNAPMPGQIIAVNVKSGQEVKENDPLLILEAMKMENIMVSPRSGIIKEVLIDTKDIVDKGQLLVTFE